EERLTDDAGAERMAAVSPDGGRIAYIAGSGGGRRLIVRALPGGAGGPMTAGGDRSAAGGAPDGGDAPGGRSAPATGNATGANGVPGADRAPDGGSARVPAGPITIDVSAPEYPAWSPDGARIAFTSGRGRVGVWVVPSGGGYANLVSRRDARPVW